MNPIRFGANTLLPGQRLTNVVEQFTVEAHKESLRLISEAGFDACEYSHYHHLSPSECEAVRRGAIALGVIPWSAHSWEPLPASPDAVSEKLPVILESVRKASLLGVSVVVFHAQNAGSDSTALSGQRQALGEVLAELNEVCEDLDIRIGIENCASKENLEFLVDVVTELQFPQIGFNIDTGHAQIHGMSPAEAIGLMGKRLVTTHLQDNHGKMDEHLPPGSGTIDWVKTRDALRAVGYTGVLMVELSDCPPNREPNPPENLRSAREFLDTVFR